MTLDTRQITNKLTLHQIYNEVNAIRTGTLMMYMCVCVDMHVRVHV